MNRRIDDIYRPTELRLRDFDEVERPLPVGDVRAQAERCLNCGIPFCHGSGCPLGNVIPEFNAAAARGNDRLAYKILSETSCFPEFTCRVCPALCEGSCTQGIDGEAVMIRQTEKHIIETAFANSWVAPVVPAKRRGKKIAIIGSGPSGLYLAELLNRMGFQVTVYERNARPGGLLRYGIPDFKLAKTVIDRRLEIMRREGIEFVTSTVIGRDVSAGYLLDRHDALALAFGTPAARDLPLPGRELDGIHFALEFLQGQNRVKSGELAAPPVNAAGKKVLVIGGGDTGSDCVGTALRQGAESVTQIEIMPQPPPERSASTPWPQWPYLLRTSSSHREGGLRRWNVATRGFFGSDGRVQGIEAEEVEWELSPTGRPLKFAAVAGTTERIRADLVLLAMGFTGVPKHGIAEELKLELSPRGTVVPDVGRRIFAAGDCFSGASLVVRAMASAAATAKQMEEVLS